MIRKFSQRSDIQERSRGCQSCVRGSRACARRAALLDILHTIGVNVNFVEFINTLFTLACEIMLDDQGRDLRNRLVRQSSTILLRPRLRLRPLYLILKTYFEKYELIWTWLMMPN
jgi:chromosome condensin MukBEF MukE localization factor